MYILLAAKRRNCSRVYKSHANIKIMASTVLILATRSNLYTIYLFNTDFLSNYLGPGTVLGDIIIFVLKKLHHTYLWKRNISGIES